MPRPPRLPSIPVAFLGIVALMAALCQPAGATGALSAPAAAPLMLAPLSSPPASAPGESPASGYPLAPLSAAAEPLAAYREALQRARQALAGHDPTSALALLDQALRLNPEGGEGFMLLGQAYRALERHAEASAALRRAVDLLGEEAPEGQDALCELAAALAREERNEAATKALRRVLALSPRRLGVHHDLGRIDLALGRLESAVREFREEIALHDEKGAIASAPPSDSPLALAYEGLGMAAYRLGHDETALTALARAPDTLEARYHLGLAMARRGRHQEAAAALRDVLKRDPDHRGALQSLARAAAALGLEDERRRSLERFQDLYRRDEERRSVQIQVKSLRLEADGRAVAGDAAGATQSLKEASRLAPEDADIMLDLGRLLHRSGDRRGSEEAFRKALELQPLSAEAHYRLGRIQADNGDIPGAIASMERAAQIEPMATSYHVHLAQAYLRMNRGEDGVRELRLARRLNPADPESSFNLGLGLAQAGALREAAAELEEAVKLGYKGPQAHHALAKIYRSLGDRERSAKHQEIYERLTRPKP